jgi:hypothetical protein
MRLRDDDQDGYVWVVTIRVRTDPCTSLSLLSDPAVFHYVEILMDAVVEADRFQSEVIWQPTSSAINPIDRARWTT